MLQNIVRPLATAYWRRRFKPRMERLELDLFQRFLARSSAYFEFGIGGSTCLAAKLVKSTVHGVDSDPAWVANVLREIGPTTKDVRLRTVDIGPVGDWGYPVDTVKLPLFENYSKAILRTGFRDYDLCLVDGRFRVACFLQALTYLPHDAVIAIHDYVRPDYWVIEEFARPIAGVGELRFFVRRPDVDEDRLGEVLAAYRTVPQ